MGAHVQRTAIQTIQMATMSLQGAKLQDIADAVGVHRNTARLWLQEPDVVEEIERLVKEARDSAKRSGASLLGEVPTVWREALKATSGPAGECPHCGGKLEGEPDHAIRLRAADSVADRFGLPKTEVQELTGALTLGDKSDEELARVTLEAAIAILDEQGHHEAAAAVRGTLAI